MKNGFKAMDSDMHVMEPCDLWQKYIDKKFLDRAPIGLNRHKRDLGVQVDGKIMPRPTPKPIPALRPIRERILNEKYPEEEARDFDNVAQVRAMDKEGLDVAILYPSRGLFVLAIDGLDPELAATSAKSPPTACTARVSSRRMTCHPQSKRRAASSRSWAFAAF